MMDNTIGVGKLYSGSPRRSIFTPDIVPCEIQKVKQHEGSYDKKAKKLKSQAGISKIEMHQL